jgi:hypothetical protein
LNKYISILFKNLSSLPFRLNVECVSSSRFYHPNNIWENIECIFSLTSCYVLNIRTYPWSCYMLNMWTYLRSPHVLSSDSFSLCYSLRVRDQVLYRYKFRNVQTLDIIYKTGEVLYIFTSFVDYVIT